MVVAEFLFIAFIVGIMTKTLLGFLATFFGLYSIYRFTRLSALLSFVLSCYWGLLAFGLGTAIGGPGAGLLLGVAGFAVGLGVHRTSSSAVAPELPYVDPGYFATSTAAESQMSSDSSGRFPGPPQGKIIDAEYRVVS